jgi:hypothetical protein
MVVDLALVARVSGSGTSLWNRKPRCRKLGCGGRASLKAKLPGKGYYEALRAQSALGMSGHGASGTGDVAGA